MSDPIFLRNLINNTVYAEQIHSAQQSAQEAAREKNIRVQQQKVKDQALAVDKLDESAGLAVREEGDRRQKDQASQGEDQDENQKSASKAATENQENQGGIQRIDITI